jgi:hypothetical protein
MTRYYHLLARGRGRGPTPRRRRRLPQSRGGDGGAPREARCRGDRRTRGIGGRRSHADVGGGGSWPSPETGVEGKKVWFRRGRGRARVIKECDGRGWW